jgi:hypothetical protein
MLEVHVGGRKTGKTTLLLEWMKESTDRVMVCHSVEMCNVVWRRSEEMSLNLDRDRFVSLEQIRNGRLHGRNVILGVDNLDLLLYSIFGAPVRRITATAIDILRV